MKTTIKIETKHIPPILSFIIPLTIRWIPETQFPYPIGYDTPMYLALGKTYAQHPHPAPLLFLILGTLYSLGIDTITSMKYLPTIFYGLIGLSTYFLGKKLLKWKNWQSFLLVLTTTLSPAMLRASWDLNKQSLALIFFITSLTLLNDLKNTKKTIIFITLTTLTAISHELIFALMEGTLLLLIIDRSYKLTKKHNTKKEIITLTLAFSSALITFLNLWYKTNITTTTEMISTTQENYYWPPTFNQILETYYLMIIPLAFIGLFYEPTIIAWLTVASIGSFSSLIPPHISIPIPERWMILLSYPIATFATNSITRLKLNTPTIKKASITIIIIIIATTPSTSLLGLTKWPPWIERPTAYIPETMSTSSIPLKDIIATKNLITNIKDNDAVLIVHMNYLGWTLYYNPNIHVIAWAEYSDLKTLEQALEYAKTKNYNKILLLWYDDNKAYQLNFTKISQNNTLSLYLYKNA